MKVKKYQKKLSDRM